MGLGGLCRRNNLFLAFLRVPIADIVLNRLIEKEDLLVHNPYLLA